MADTPIKTGEDAHPRRAGYKSWKKKYRKMRISFEQKMHDGEDIFKQESKAAATVKRLAVENDRLLDILADINNRPQIPPEKRMDVSLPPPSGANEPCLPIDRDHHLRDTEGMKRLVDLLNDVPHLSATVAKESKPSLVADLDKADGETYPAHFLSPDDVDNYLHIVDSKLDPDTHIPTLAPLAHPHDHPPLHPLLQNPNSSTSWLRRHAPHIFLQGHEADGHADGGDEEGGHHTGGGRKSRGGGRGGERGGRASTRGKRASAASRATADRHADWDAVDDDANFGSTPAPKGKRKRDDDPGYRPKGGSGSRPTKKKRKSEGADGTPSAKKSKKEPAAAGGGDD